MISSCPEFSLPLHSAVQLETSESSSTSLTLNPLQRASSVKGTPRNPPHPHASSCLQPRAKGICMSTVSSHIHHSQQAKIQVCLKTYSSPLSRMKCVFLSRIPESFTHAALSLLSLTYCHPLTLDPVFPNLACLSACNSGSSLRTILQCPSVPISPAPSSALLAGPHFPGSVMLHIHPLGHLLHYSGIFVSSSIHPTKQQASQVKIASYKLSYS